MNRNPFNKTILGFTKRHNTSGNGQVGVKPAMIELLNRVLEFVSWEIIWHIFNSYKRSHPTIEFVIFSIRLSFGTTF